MEFNKNERLTDFGNEEKNYTFQYNQLHQSTLELKIKEKDQLLLELSAINQEIYQEMNECQAKFQAVKLEKENLLLENLGLKEKINEKNNFIDQQSITLSKLRNQISSFTNGNSFSLEEKSISYQRREDLMQQLKALQSKYDYREELIISLQEERISLLNDIDKYRNQLEVFEQISRILDVQQEHVLRRIVEISDGKKNESRENDIVLSAICSKLGCENTDLILNSINRLNFIIKSQASTIEKVKRYFHLHYNTSLEELDKYITNLLL